MQQTLVDLAVLCLIVFLFFVMSQGRRDTRLWFWTGGWLWIVAHFAIRLWLPASQLWIAVRTCINIDALLLAAACFIYSHAILRMPERKARKIAIYLIPATLLVVDLAISGWPSAFILAILILGRQILAIFFILSARRQLRFTRFSVLVAVLVAIWLVFSTLNGHTEIVVYGLLFEVYLSAAMNFYAYGWRRSMAVRTMIAGFVVWAAVFPIAALVTNMWPHIQVSPEVWNLPKFFVAIGMILAVIEEDTCAARALADDYRLLFDDNPEPFWIVEVETLRFLAVNRAALDLHGYTREEFLSMKLTDVLPPETCGDAIMAVESKNEKFHRAKRHLRKDGSTVTVDIRAEERTFQGKSCRFVLAIDVTERENLQQQLDHQSTHDLLTGLANRTSLFDQLANTAQYAVNTDEKFAVLSIDIDRFKRINDAYGLRIGDACIEHIAGILISHVRSADIVARTGGDEFTIILGGLTSAISAEQEGRDLIHQFHEPIVIEGYRLQIPISIGMAVGPDDGSDPATLWRSAESALKAAKASGGSTVVRISSELKKTADEQLQLESYLRTNMGEGLYLEYQPIYAIDGKIHGMEALLRLTHPKLGEVKPARLIPIAESSGLIIPLGEWAIEEICHQILIWKSQNLPLVPVAVNVSGLQIMHEKFADRLMATLERHAIDPRLIHVEITESTALHEVDAVTEKVVALSRRGIEFSIDDFGTGHSSLSRLSQLGASILKIDRSFLVSGCTSDEHLIVQAIITMAHELGYRVVAEGVETESQLLCLRDLRCDLYQGFLLSRPIPPNQISSQLGKINSAFEQRTTKLRKLHVPAPLFSSLDPHPENSIGRNGSNS